MQEKKKDDGDQAPIRQQRSGQERPSGKPDRDTDARRAENEHRGNGAPTAGGTTRRQERVD